MISRRIALATALAPMAAPAFAQSWPNGPIRIIAPFPPGGSVDTVARLLQQPLQAELGVPVIVENRAGASGALGTAQVARAAPDGQSFVLVFDTHATNPALIANLGFDTRRDLAPVWLLGTAPNMLLVHRSRPWTTMAQLVAAAKARPDAITYGTIGNGSLAHLGMVLAQRAGGFSLTHVPYRGGGPLATAGMAGETDLYAATGTAGNQRFMRYFIQGLKNTPCSPTFTQVRDGVIQAATAINGGADVCTLWRAFAGFGLGTDAVSGGSTSTTPTNGFAVPTTCQ